MLLKHILHKITYTNWLSILIIALSVTSCSTPVQPQQTLRYPVADSLETLLAEVADAEKQAAPIKQRRLTNIAQRLSNIGELKQSMKVLDIIEHRQLDDIDYLAFITTAGNIYTQGQSLFKAQSLLTEQRLERLWHQLSIEKQKQTHTNRAAIYQQIGNATASLNEYIALGTLLSETGEISANNELIWQQLSTLTPTELANILAATTETILQQWLQLSSISKAHQGDLETHNAEISAWQYSHPNHPASQHPPASLKLLQTLITKRPKNIALLLPLQGKLTKAGQAIRDGFFAAYYQAKERNDKLPNVRLYDTSTGNINSVYDQAALDGANLIIGPLSKKHVETLWLHASLTIPTLALNYIGTSYVGADAIGQQRTVTAPFYQFGLSLEDEAEQVADRAWLEGHRHALIISSAANWSQRAVTAFINRWQQYGGTVATHKSLNKQDNRSETIARLLHINESKQRAVRLKRVLGRSFEFEPRRRADIDMIFLVARSQEGQLIKPMLNFHYASTIPVYSTSQIISSSSTKDKNIDLNGIRLTTLPWILHNNIEEKELIKNNIKVNPGYERLYALGIDSFLLYPRLQQLYQLPNQQLYGATGKLSMTKERRILRQQLWADIYQGELRPLPTLTLPTDTAL